jgi:hypothetical protein
MEYPDSSRPRQRRRIELPQEQDAESVVLVAVGGNHPATTINDLNDDLVSESLALLGGVGNFRYGPLACKQFLKGSEKNPHFKKITSGESVTSSISCARKYFEDEGTGSDQVKFFWINAAKYGRIREMQWARQEEYSAVFIEKFGVLICAKAAEEGQLQVLQWLKENGCPCNILTCAAAARYGHLACLQWARENGCRWNSDITTAAAKNGHLSCLQWARENGCDWYVSICYAAALNGHLSCLQWARANGCLWDEDTCSNAALNGHLSCLQWARENGCPWNVDTLVAAAEGGHLSCVQWARENGCPEE